MKRSKADETIFLRLPDAGVVMAFESDAHA